MVEYAVWGEVEITSYKDIPEMKSLIAKKMSNIPLNVHEQIFMQMNMTKQVCMRNMIMRRFLDRFCALFSHSPSQHRDPSPSVEYAQEDYWYYMQAIQREARIDYLGATSDTSASGTRLGIFPELIGVGDDNTPATKFDRGLYSPVANGYRNTWNSREGGTNVGTADNHSFRCASVWDGAFVPANPIEEIGLFQNWVFVAKNSFVNTPPWQIDFTNGAAGNLAWDIYNISMGVGDAAGVVASEYLNTIIRDDNGSGVLPTFTFSRATQFIIYNGALVANVGPAGTSPTSRNDCIISFSPDVNHSADTNVPTQGNVDNWSAPPNNANNTDLPMMYARAVLPSPFTKLAGDTMTIVWVIHFERLDGEP